MLSFFVIWPLRLVTWLLALVGIAALVLAAMVLSPLPKPAVNRDIAASARALAGDELPALGRFQARDGTELAYRLYPSIEAGADTIAILIHGSAGSSVVMNRLAETLADEGVPVVAPDIRGHGASGERGDIGYIGQLEDDLDDLVASLRAYYPDARLVLVGHSSGGGFALRVAASPSGDQFARFVLLAPYLGPFAPTTRPVDGDDVWAYPDIPRIVALDLLRDYGFPCCESLPALAFALPPEQAPDATLRYSYRLMENFGAPKDTETAFADAAAPIAVLAGTDDTLIDADGFAQVVGGAEPPVALDILPGIGHMDILSDPAALDRVVTAVKAR